MKSRQPWEQRQGEVMSSLGSWRVNSVVGYRLLFRRVGGAGISDQRFIGVQA